MSDIERLSAYRIMWVFVFFDLPTELPKHKKAYVQFRNGLIKDGFSMMQYSVYIRHCASRESMATHIRRVESILPKEGKISVMEVTDKQYGRIRNYWGKAEVEEDKTPKQLEMF